MFKNLKAALISVLALSTPALAEAPWERAAPQMSQAQRDGVAQIRKVLTQNSLEFPGRNPSELGFKFDYVHKAPISNISGQSLEKLLNGKYQIYTNKGRSPGASDLIQVKYYQGGQVHLCKTKPNAGSNGSAGKWSLANGPWGSIRSFSGFAGYVFKPTGKSWGFPVVYNSETGDFAIHHFIVSASDKEKVWSSDIGHIQSDYAPIFAKICPNLPKSNTVNESQVAMDYTTFRKQAGNSVLRNAVTTIYRSNVQAPVTLGMFYSAFPPTAQ